MDLSDFCTEFGRLESWRMLRLFKKTAAFHSVRQIPLIALPPLRFPGSQCEQKPYPPYNLQRSLLIWKDHSPKRGSVAISAPIKVFRPPDLDLFKNLSDKERSTFNSEAEQYYSKVETASKAV